MNKIKKYISWSDFFESLVSQTSELATPEILNNPNTIAIKYGLKVTSDLLIKLFTNFKKEHARGSVISINDFSQKQHASFQELLKILSEQIIDDDKFKALQSIFFKGISKDSTEKDQVLALEFLSTLQKISVTEILILKANFEIANKEIKSEVTKAQLDHGIEHRDSWYRAVSTQMGYGHEMFSLVSKYEENLENQGFISKRIEMDRLQSQFPPTKNFRLTDMGYKFCEFITNYTSNE